MSRDDIIEILEWHPSHVEHGEAGLLSRIERVLAVAVAAEREACAEIVNDNTDGDGLCCADDLLAAIRARGQQ